MFAFLMAWLASLFAKPKLRVRKLDMETGYYVHGTVVKETHTSRPHAPEALTYWSVTWDDAPAVTITVPSYGFLWHDGCWTRIER